MAEDPLDDRAASVRRCSPPLRVTDLLTEHLERPSVQAPLDNDECRVERLDERIGAEYVLEVIVTGAAVGGVREPRRVRTGFACEVA